MAESTQKKLSRVRPPRVQIEYDLEIGDAIQKKELPMVVGAMADLSGNPSTPLPKMTDRTFVEIDRDNFNDVLKGANPRLAYRVPSTMTDDDSKLGVELKFESMEDFEPHRLVQQIEPLKQLMETRKKLTELLAKMDGNDELAERLDDIIRDTDKVAALGGGPTGDSPKSESN